MSFTPRLNSNGMQGNPWWYSSGNPFYASGYGLPNCTCYAYGRYAEIRNGFANLPTGDGKDWYANATAFERGSVPKLGAVVCYGSTSGNYGGHVAIVEQINSDGSIVTSNSAYHGTYFFLNTVYPADNYLPSWATTSRDYYLQGFIYNDAGGTQISGNDWVIAAICGVWWGESGCNPAVWESLQVMPWDYVYGTQGPNKGGYGLGQWTNTGPGDGMRLERMYNELTRRGYSMEDGGAQLDYFANIEKLWYPNTGTYDSLEDFLNSDSNVVQDLVYEFIYNWEGVQPWTELINQRVDYAIDAYRYIQLHKNDNPADYQWIFDNRYLASDKILNNVMCIYFWLYSGSAPKKKRSFTSNPIFTAAMNNRNILITRRK